jgi:soluble lytic murein transglycosylase-like protein
MHLVADAVLGPRTLSAIVRRDHVPVRVEVHVTEVAERWTVYVVRPGDSLTAIAAAHGTTIAAIASLNHIDPARPIVIGQRLKLPVGSSPALSSSSSSVPALLDEWAARLGVDPHLVRALAWMESGFQTNLVSSAGARGVLQTLPSTRSYVETVLVGHALPRTVDGDIEVGILYLRHLLQVFRGNERLALAGWYQGERAVRAHGQYKVSKPFVANVLALRTRM